MQHLLDMCTGRFCPPALGVVVGVLLLATGACDPTVDVLNPSEKYQFSLFGTLRVTADTQVIRVEPIGDSTRIGAPPTLRASVVLENLDTGREIMLQDSFETVSGGIAQVHNVRTTEPVQPGTNYRVAVRVKGTAVTTATTATPEAPPILQHEPDSTDDAPFLLPCAFDFQGEPEAQENTFSLRILGVENVAAATVRYRIEPPGQRVASSTQFDHYADAVYRPQKDLYRLSVFYAWDLLSLFEQTDGCPPREAFSVPQAVVRVTAGGPDWPDWRGASLDALARPDTFSNVTGGHGFVGGVYADTIHIPVQRRE